jgi:isopenicillin N synthase-like dioxygenase
MEQLVRKLVPLYVRTLRFPLEYFDQPFREPQCKLRMTHYPYQTDLSDEFEIAPHTGTSFLTLLASNDVPVCRYARKPANGSMRPTISGAFILNRG